jgi:hypothetical protein
MFWLFKPFVRAKTKIHGFKVVPAPQSKERRKIMEGPDITASGGARTKHQKNKQ